MTTPLAEQFGNIDIYVFDQLLRGRFASASASAAGGRYGETSPKLSDPPGASEGGPVRVFDAGCGGGRNLVYLLRQGFDVFGNDLNPEAVAKVRALAPESDFRVEAIEDTSFAEASADVVVASAVLHFARDAAHFEAMLRSLWRVLKPGGVFFARLASTIGIEDQVQAEPASPRLAPPARVSGGGRYRLPDGSDRYLVDAATLIDWTARLGGELLDPIKTTVVHDQRSMTTWVARRR